VGDADELPDAMLAALSYDDKIIVEKWVDGVELAVSVLRGEDGAPVVLSPVEIVAKSGLFDYSAMYTAGETDYFVPARLDDATTVRVRDLALAVHELLGCRDISRTDMVVDADGTPWVLECNTSPGMTETSLLPMAAEADGISFADVVERLVRASLTAS
jgi:D-alanine-D-alanine ligase